MAGRSVGKEPGKHGAAERLGRMSGDSRASAMSWVCTSVSLTPSAAKPLGSVGPQCQARIVGSDAANALLSSFPALAAIRESSWGDASSRTTRSNGR